MSPPGAPLNKPRSTSCKVGRGFPLPAWIVPSPPAFPLLITRACGLGPPPPHALDRNALPTLCPPAAPSPPSPLRVGRACPAPPRPTPSPREVQPEVETRSPTEIRTPAGEWQGDGITGPLPLSLPPGADVDLLMDDEELHLRKLAALGRLSGSVAHDWSSPDSVDR